MENPIDPETIRAGSKRDRDGIPAMLIPSGLYILVVTPMLVWGWPVADRLASLAGIVAYLGIVVLGGIAILRLYAERKDGPAEGTRPRGRRELIAWIAIWGSVSAQAMVTLYYPDGVILQTVNLVAVAAVTWMLSRERATGDPWPNWIVVTALFGATAEMQVAAQPSPLQPVAIATLFTMGMIYLLGGIVAEIQRRKTLCPVEEM